MRELVAGVELDGPIEAALGRDVVAVPEDVDQAQGHLDLGQIVVELAGARGELEGLVHHGLWNGRRPSAGTAQVCRGEQESVSARPAYGSGYSGSSPIPALKWSRARRLPLGVCFCAK